MIGIAFMWPFDHYFITVELTHYSFIGLMVSVYIQHSKQPCGSCWYSLRYLHMEIQLWRDLKNSKGSLQYKRYKIQNIDQHFIYLTYLYPTHPPPQLTVLKLVTTTGVDLTVLQGAFHQFKWFFLLAWRKVQNFAQWSRSLLKPHLTLIHRNTCKLEAHY